MVLGQRGLWCRYSGLCDPLTGGVADPAVDVVGDLAILRVKTSGGFAADRFQLVCGAELAMRHRAVCGQSRWERRNGGERRSVLGFGETEYCFEGRRDDGTD